jgi:GLPGLI family protein
MKKNNFLFIVIIGATLLFLPLTGYSQGRQRYPIKGSKWTHFAIDTCQYVVTYEFKFCGEMGKTKSGDDIYYDTKRVEVGNRFVRYHTYLGERMDSLGHVYSKEYSWHDKLGVNNNPTWEDVYFNYPKSGELFFTSLLINYEYCYVGPIPKMEWKMIDGQDTTIINHKCYMATTDFCGRHYIAWFAPDIPMRYGPYKFNGLPGMILKIEDDEKFFTWTAISLVTPRTIKPMYFEQAKTVVKTDRKGYLKMLNMFWKDPGMFYKSQGARVYVGGIGYLQPGQVSLPQIPEIENE